MANITNPLKPNFVDPQIYAQKDASIAAALFQSAGDSSFLWQAAAEMHDYDGVLSSEALHHYLVERDGTSPYSIAEIEELMNEGDCFA